jgi:ribosomal protein S18 acetylase RimI-like enzyme
VLAVLAPAVGPNPTTEEVERVALRYRAESTWEAFATGHPTLIGFIGIERLRAGEIRLRHIAVDRDHRRQGAGSAMIAEVAEAHDAHIVTAETWSGATGFYKRLGFTVTAIGRNSAGDERFWCRRETA